MNDLNCCLLTGIKFDGSEKLFPQTGSAYVYQFSPVGKVKIALPTVIEFTNNRKFNHPILAGICRQAFELKVEPPLINTEFIQTGLINYSFPKSFKEKAKHFLKLLYDMGGNDYKLFHLKSLKDYPLGFCVEQKEFIQLMEHCYKNNFIEWKHEQIISLGRRYWNDVTLTEYGINEVQKELPNIPMIGLVSQEISIGDNVIDEKINHAKKLFFQEPQTLDNMRSACESLSFVLEPLRKEIANYVLSEDVSDFFQLVNTFDIRHNKNHTKNLQYSEQFEWVFYSLLNTLNTYSKLKKRIT